MEGQLPEQHNDLICGRGWVVRLLSLVIPHHCPLRHELQQQIRAHFRCYTTHQGIHDLLGDKFVSQGSRTNAVLQEEAAWLVLVCAGREGCL